MFKGTLFITTDTNILQQMAYTNRIISLKEMPSQMQSFNVIPGSILLPPYNAMEAQMDANINEFYRLYYIHLYRKEPQEFIATVLRALMLGTNIVLYCDPDEYQLFGAFLLQYLQADFGITVGTVNNPFYFDPLYIPAICTLLYINDLMPVDEFFILYPESFVAGLNDLVLPKLVEDLHPIVDIQSREAYLDYFIKLAHRVKENKKFRRAPITMGV